MFLVAPDYPVADLSFVAWSGAENLNGASGWRKNEKQKFRRAQKRINRNSSNTSNRINNFRNELRML